MSRVEELTKELTEAITDSCEYKRFKEFESEVMKRPDLKRALDDFRRENFRMQYSEDTGDVLSATQELEGHFADIRKQPEVEGILQLRWNYAEWFRKSVCQLLKQLTLIWISCNNKAE